MRGEVTFRTFVISVLVMAVLVSYSFFQKSQQVPVQTVTEVAPPEPEPVSLPVQEETFYSERDLECLALNSYYESRNQSIAGQIAVAQVVLNRVESPKFPNTICDVIYQGPTYTNWKGNEMPVRNRCHFSWWCDGKSDIPVDVVTYHKILDMLTDLVYSDTIDITDGSTHYHADYVEPDWSKSFTKTVVIDDHIFYRW
jgi:spore germination cell wall hydrolase CwlJ-like protein